jgi:hypothetical protein
MQLSTPKFCRFGAAMLLLSPPWIAPAGRNDPLSGAELARLPDHCLAKQPALRGDTATL